MTGIPCLLNDFSAETRLNSGIPKSRVTSADMARADGDGVVDFHQRSSGRVSEILSSLRGGKLAWSEDRRREGGRWRKKGLLDGIVIVRAKAG
jgi:hypothetical protein